MGNGKTGYGDDRIRFFLGDVRDKERLYRAMDGVDFVVMPLLQKLCPLLNTIRLNA